MDYLSKWPEVIAVVDQTAHTVGTFLVEHVIYYSRHGVLTELLSEFLAGSDEEVCAIISIHQINTTASQPSSNRWFKRTVSPYTIQ